ncbi:uncharacterized protein LOC134528181 isoform X2 [Bacillus rossius redtenbacheri]|uniref:uncharacterized protein LOC134528181 isoform X2 n=1 Tax=Bacillus rossius redtenbacheri TaxID=93214 RepID=UPI002FDDBE57
MPIFSDLSLYYSGGPPPSQHHLLFPATGRYNVYSRPLPARSAYSPLLPAISEASSLSPVFARRSGPLSRAPAYRAPRPVHIDTADIDVSAPRRYGGAARAERPGTIRRDRPLVRLHTKKAPSSPAGREKTRGAQLVEKFLIRDKPPAPPLKEVEVLDCILAETAQDQSRAEPEVKQKRKKKSKTGDLEESSSEAENAAEKTTLRRRNTVKHIRKLSLDYLSESPLVHRQTAHPDEDSAVKSPTVPGNDCPIPSEGKERVSETTPGSANQQKNKISFEVSVDNHDDIILRSKRLPFRIIVDDVKVEENTNASPKSKPKKFRYKITVEDDSCDLRKSVKQIKRYLMSKKLKDNMHGIIPSSINASDNSSLEIKDTFSTQDHRMNGILHEVNETVLDKNIGIKSSCSDSESNEVHAVDQDESKSVTVIHHKSSEKENIETSLQNPPEQKNSKTINNLSVPNVENKEHLPILAQRKSTEDISLAKMHVEETKELPRTSQFRNIPVIEKDKKNILSATAAKEAEALSKIYNKTHVTKKLQGDASGISNQPSDSVISPSKKDGNPKAFTKLKLNLKISSSDLQHQHFKHVSTFASSRNVTEVDTINTSTKTTGGEGEENSSTDEPVDFWALLKSPSVTEVVESGRTVLRYQRTLSGTIPEQREENSETHTHEIVNETKKSKPAVKKYKVPNDNKKAAIQKVNKSSEQKSELSLNACDKLKKFPNEGFDSTKDMQNIPLKSSSYLSEITVSSSETIRTQATKDISFIEKSSSELPATVPESRVSSSVTLEELKSSEEGTKVKDNQTSGLRTDCATKSKLMCETNKPSKLKLMYEELDNTLEAGKSLTIKQEEESKPYLEVMKSLSQLAEMSTNVSSCSTLREKVNINGSESGCVKLITDEKELVVSLKKISQSLDYKSLGTVKSLIDKNKSLGPTEDRRLNKCGLKIDPKIKSTDFVDKQSELKLKTTQSLREDVVTQIKSTVRVKSLSDKETSKENEKIFSADKDSLEHVSENNKASAKQETESEVLNQHTLEKLDNVNIKQSTNLTEDKSLNFSTLQHGATPDGLKCDINKKPSSENDKKSSSRLEMIQSATKAETAKVVTKKEENTSIVAKTSHERIAVKTVQKSAKPDSSCPNTISTEGEKLSKTAKLGRTQEKIKGAKTSTPEEVTSERKPDGDTSKETETRGREPADPPVTSSSPGSSLVSSVATGGRSVAAAGSSAFASDGSAGGPGSATVAEGTSVAAADSSSLAEEEDAAGGETETAADTARGPKTSPGEGAGDSEEEGSSSEDEDSSTEESDEEGGSSDGGKDPPSSPPGHSPDLRLDECPQRPRRRCSSVSSGRVTPPATTIPRFRKYAIDDFNFLKVLGKGSYGKVLLAELKNTECYYAVKCLKKDVVLEDDDVECTLIERKVLALGTKHPYLCHLFATFQTESHLFFVMEYLNGGDLMFHIQQGGRFPEPRARFYAAEIVSGLRFLHHKGIVYRDLKLDNVLLDFDGHIRIADFGMCKLQIFLDRTADTFCGTPDYMAPEVIKGQKYNQCVDWWSFGVLLYEMVVGQSPFSGCDEDDLFWSICNEQPHFPRHLSAEASGILALLLEKDSSKRLGTPQCDAGDVIDQPFFRPVDWAALERRGLEPPFRPRVKHPLDVQYFDKTFTNERAKITPVDRSILQSMDQTQFQGFSYTNPYATE